jgi:N-acetylneuraminic acid mutarotase
MEVHVIETSVYETTVKPMPRRKRLQFVRLIMVAILMIGFIMPGPSAAAPGTNSFTGTASVTDRITFTTTGSMNEVHYYHTATLLNDGKVLVAGGSGGGASAELYDPDTGTWSSTGNMSVVRNGHTATLLSNGQVLVAGGLGVSSSLASAELYDPVAGTWSTTGSMTIDRNFHSATLLTNGKVLVAGGENGYLLYPYLAYLASAELYDPDTGTWSTTSSMNVVRSQHTATLLNNGQVLIAGGRNGTEEYIPNLDNAELYDPFTGTWSTTGSMNVGRQSHTATLLKDGKVLVAGGTDGYDWLASAELYNPSTGTWSTTGSMNVARFSNTATLLNNGKVLVAGGYVLPSPLASAELFDPVAGTWSTTGSMTVGRHTHTATLLNDGKVLVEGGLDSLWLDSAELGILIPSNTFTGILTLPSGWLNSSTISAEFVGTSSDAAINAGALSNDNNTWGSWVAATSDEIITTTWTNSGEGANKPVYLRLRDVNGQETTVVTGTVNVDLTKPTSTMTALPAFSPANILLAWSGTDALSGISTYDVQVRAGIGGAWTNILSSTTNTSTNYTGANGITYYFRVRATDAAGNIATWREPYDTFTLVDTENPVGAVVINKGMTTGQGALYTTSPNVILALSTNDNQSGVISFRASSDGINYDSWYNYIPAPSANLGSGDGLKTIYVQFRDAVGNVSSAYTDTITLDTHAGSDYGLSINTGATWTNSTAVTLTIPAQTGTAEMQVSNDGGFAGAQWELYSLYKDWQIISYGNYVIPRTVYVRFRNTVGSTSGGFSDDIILDVTPPTGSVIITSATETIGESNNASPSKSISDLSVQATNLQFKIYLPLVVRSEQPCQGCIQVRAILNATDDVSGVGYVMFSNNDANFSNAVWEAYATEKNWQVPSTGTTTVYVKFRDNAGNVSTTYSATYTP